MECATARLRRMNLLVVPLVALLAAAAPDPGTIAVPRGRAPVIDFVDTPEELRDRYQYFTEARMEKLRAAGWSRPSTSLEAGVARYVERLLASR